jgi:hypothetical protein
MASLLRDQPSTRESLLGMRFVVSRRPIPLRVTGKLTELPSFARVGIAEELMRAWDGPNLFAHASRFARTVARRVRRDTESVHGSSIDISPAGTVIVLTSAAGVQTAARG